MSTLVALGATAVLAIPVTALLCRRQIRRKKRVGIPVVLLGTLIPAACMIVPIFICERGSEALVRQNTLATFKVLSINALGVCFLSAMLTVIFYQTRNKKIHDA